MEDNERTCGTELRAVKKVTVHIPEVCATIVGQRATFRLGNALVCNLDSMRPIFSGWYLPLRFSNRSTRKLSQLSNSPLLQRAAKFVGSDACAQCHNDGHDLAAYQAAGKEYAIWANRDPHSCAYSNLFNDQSKSIAKNLRLDSPPHKNDLCLNCHATNPSNQQLALCNKHTVTDGVGCESCHGPAEKWLVPHRLPDWKHWSPSQKSSIGFLDTDNLATARGIAPSVT